MKRERNEGLEGCCCEGVVADSSDLMRSKNFWISGSSGSLGAVVVVVCWGGVDEGGGGCVAGACDGDDDHSQPIVDGLRLVAVMCVLERVARMDGRLRRCRGMTG